MLKLVFYNEWLYNFLSKNYFCLMLSIFILPYFLNSWWRFIPITILIFWISCFIKKLDYLGATIFPPKIVCGVLLIAGIIASKQFISYQLEVNKITYLSHSIMWHITVIFQALNEELVLRAVLLKTLTRILHSNYLMASIAAVSFALLHYIFYYWADGVRLNILAVAVVFLFGFICNLLFLKYQHIWFGYSLHLSWNLARFTGDYFLPGMSKIEEGKLFNLLEGSYILLLFLVLGASYTIFLIRR